MVLSVNFGINKAKDVLTTLLPRGYNKKYLYSLNATRTVTKIILYQLINKCLFFIFHSMLTVVLFVFII